jgi:hypothetical protein
MNRSMRRTSRRTAGWVAVPAIAFAIALGACGEDDDVSTAVTEPATPTAQSDQGPGSAMVNPCAGEVTGAPSIDTAVTDGSVTEITATEYEFVGFVAEYPAGPLQLRMSNEGAEAHELVVVRVNDDETRPTEELLALPESEMQQTASAVGATSACPGRTSDVLALELVPGRYVALCLVPTGLTPDVASSEEAIQALGAPHFTHGMFAEFSVEEG